MLAQAADGPRGALFALPALRELAGASLASAIPASPDATVAPAPEAVQVPLPKTAAEVRGPVGGNTMTPAYVQLVGRMAYVWG